MAITVGYLTDQAATKYLDEAGDDISESAWLKYYNLAQAMIVGLVPSAFATGVLLDLVAGVVQSLPASTVELISLPMNMPAGVPGAVIRETNLEIMNECCPGWTAETAAATVEHFMRIPGNNMQIMVYPRNDGKGKVLAQVARTPDLVVEDAGDTWKNQEIALGDKYAGAILNAMMFNAYDEDSDNPGNAGRADIHYTRLIQSLGLKEARQTKREGKQ